MKLINVECSDIFITAVDGTRLTENHGFTLTVKPVENGCVGYLNGFYDKGLSGEGSILVRPIEQMREIDYVATVNPSLFWCRPFFGQSLCDIPSKTQHLLAYDGRLWHCILPVCADTFKTLLHGYKDGLEFILSTNCDGVKACNDQLSFVYLTGEKPHELVKQCAKTAAELLGNRLKMREQRKMPEVFEYLGWCSWDAMQIRVSHEGLLEKAREFKEKEIPVRFAIIDDMWANVPNLATLPPDIEFSKMVFEMHKSKLECFEGDHKRFPKGMKAAIDDLKKEGIPKVGIWFPTTGYWAGFVDGGKDATLFASDLVYTPKSVFRSVEGGGLIVAPTEQATARFFDELCRRVSEWNGDFVKIDNQGCHSLYQNMTPIGQSARYMQKAIEEATQKHFNGALINCMGMPSECLFNRPDSAVNRCSDDFMPESKEWFAKNILQCSYNGLLQGQYYINDWDMWWTDDAQATQNSLCRAVSGGPIYVSDKIGRSRPEILKPVCFSDGRIPRCDNSATPAADCLVHNPTTSQKPFKIQNRVGSNGVVAVFNIDQDNRCIGGTVSPSDANLPDGKYVYYEYFSGTAGVLDKGEAIEISLENNEALRLYTFLPYKGVVAIGRKDLFVGVKAVVSFEQDELTLYEGGELAFFSEAPIRILADGAELEVKRNGCLTTVVTKKEQIHLTISEMR